MTHDMIDDSNWILGSGGTSQFPPKPSSPPPSSPPQGFTPFFQQPISHLTSSSDQLARHDITASPAMPGISNGMRPSSAGSYNSKFFFIMFFFLQLWAYYMLLLHAN